LAVCVIIWASGTVLGREPVEATLGLALLPALLPFAGVCRFFRQPPLVNRS
jgi:hypothetical protein